MWDSRSTAVQVLIPVSGRQSAGHLRSTAVFRDGNWHLTHLVLEFRGRTEKLVIMDKNRCIYRCEMNQNYNQSILNKMVTKIIVMIALNLVQQQLKQHFKHQQRIK